MKILPITPPKTSPPKEMKALFSKLEFSLKSAGASFEKSVRLAKTLAPLLNDQTSNTRHLETINSHAPIQEKVIAVLMLGFPKNRPMLPTLQEILSTGSDALRMASAIAISQMRDGENNDILCDILLTHYRTESASDVKKALRQAILSLVDKKTALLVSHLVEN